MKVSESWLREWVDPNVSVAELAEQLTMAGLEIDGIEALGAMLEGVVVGEIIGAEQHPDAEKLRVCSVNAGDETVQIVCGAPNARVGLKAPLAKIGAKLPPAEEGEKPFKIKKAKLRGVESMGMLCAMEELGLGEESDGLWELAADAIVGQNLTEYLGLPDNILEIDLTPNRSDCLSVAGVAREISVINRLPLSEPTIEAVASTVDTTFPVSLAASADCPRYLGRVIENVDLSRGTPLWMQQRLQRCGMRSIDPAVDVTNYVMLELGQPMHAFDLDTLAGGISVRYAGKGERLTLLDDAEIELNEKCLLIADANKALALAGIMGGQGSGVQTKTTHLMLEAAHFTPEKIAGRARHFGLHTESSHRFERGVDPELPRKAMERATKLLLDMVGGQAGPITEAVEVSALPEAPSIHLRRPQIKRLLGFELEDSEVEDILGRLDLGLSVAQDGWQVSVPSARFDIAIEADLLEELARIYGYNRLPTSQLKHAGQLSESGEAEGSVGRLKNQLCSLDYQEAITYSFIDPSIHAEFYADEHAVPLRNPISSEMSVMRTSLLPGLVQALDHNVKRQQTRVRLFEVGQCFISNGGQNSTLAQQQMLGGAICGGRLDERWSHDKTAADFFDVKGDVEAVLSLSGHDAGVDFQQSEHKAMHPGQCAEVIKNGQSIGHLGALHPRLLRSLDLPKNTLVFELNLHQLLEGSVPSYEKVSKFPEVRRDLAILIKLDLSVAEISRVVRETAGPILTNLIVFDVYAGKGVPEGQKSLGLGLTLQDHSRTLNDEDVSSCLGLIVAELKEKFGASLRN
ncbi:MAG: phenylalanine--tRNA ligase subunit beta [Pseudomonadales bacterium]